MGSYLVALLVGGADPGGGVLGCPPLVVPDCPVESICAAKVLYL